MPVSRTSGTRQRSRGARSRGSELLLAVSRRTRGLSRPASEHTTQVGERYAGIVQCDQGVEQQVCSFLRCARTITIGEGDHQLGGFFPDLLQAQISVGKKPTSIAWRCVIT